MKWIKKGLIFAPNSKPFSWIKRYASQPVVDTEEKNLRIYFSTRDEKGRSLITFLETDKEYPEKVVYVHDKPILPLGEMGTFDDNGMMPSCIVRYKEEKRLYYIGWNPQKTVSYKLAVGLAISTDNGKTFSRYSQGPICDREPSEPFFNSTTCVLREENQWKMWYISCTGWRVINNWPEPEYHIKYATSSNGIHWIKTGLVCIDYDEHTRAIAGPCVYTEDNLYKMFYSYRGIKNYRNSTEQSYKIGYAESEDGIHWQRKDKEINLYPSTQGWDAIMNEYAATYLYKGKRYLIYNGDGFGKTGFGYATLEK